MHHLHVLGNVANQLETDSGEVENPIAALGSFWPYSTAPDSGLVGDITEHMQVVRHH